MFVYIHIFFLVHDECDSSVLLVLAQFYVLSS